MRVFLIGLVFPILLLSTFACPNALNVSHVNPLKLYLGFLSNLLICIFELIVFFYLYLLHLFIFLLLLLPS